MSDAVMAQPPVLYNDAVVKKFVIATMFWGVVAFLVGVYIAAELAWPSLNLGLSFTNFGRLRPVHTSAAIFAFGGSALLGTSFYVVQRTCRARLFGGEALANFVFWGYQFFIVMAALSYVMGFSQGKEYAEPEWHIDLWLTVVWVSYLLIFLGTILKRTEPHIYVANWFYLAFIVTVAVLHLVNNAAVPISVYSAKSYSAYSGVQDALVQWWYGHNAVAFFLTTPILGIMYYFVPKAAERPVYSYRLSVIHFWSLVFVYIWAGPHHLLNTALPNWLQSLGMTFSLMLWAPSWGGMLNGLLTLRGAWDKVRTDPVLKFMAAAVTFYGMATFEGPLLSIKSVNALGHYTDWIIGHVHAGTLGWNGFMAAGMIYWLVPRLWNRPLHSVPMANLHFWLGTVGILLYVAAMWTSGITQGYMLGATTEHGTILAYPNFLDTVTTIKPMMLMRVIGGGFYLTGFILLAVNVFRTVRGAEPVNGTIEVFADEPEQDHAAESMGVLGTLLSPPVLFSVLGIGFACVWMFGADALSIAGLIGLILSVIIAYAHFESRGKAWAGWYDRLLVNAAPFTILTFIAVAAGGAIQIIPTVIAHQAANIEDRRQVPYSPLELAGRDIYVREGCYLCHSQMIRTLVPDVLRYGRAGVANDYSRLGESIYDHPFQWGSKRTGPDLAHIGGKYPNIWHLQHMQDPRSVSAGSIMPGYPWLSTDNTDVAVLPKKIAVQRTLGVPFPEWTPAQIAANVAQQSKGISADLRTAGAYIAPEKEIVALIAYLQHLGASEKTGVAPAPQGASAP
jgi:cytochrome c oxidase cbb3-type subunit I/II